MRFEYIVIIFGFFMLVSFSAIICLAMGLKNRIVVAMKINRIIEKINEEKTVWLFNDGQLFKTNDFLESLTNTNILKMMFYRKIFTGNKNLNFGFLLDHNIEVFESTLCEIVSEIERKEKVIRNFQQQRNKFK
jgi:hypothetical protein